MLWNVGMAMISFHWLLFHSFFILLFYFLWGDSRPDGRLPLMSNRTDKESNVGEWVGFRDAGLSQHVRWYGTVNTVNGTEWPIQENIEFMWRNINSKLHWGSKQSRCSDVALPDRNIRQTGASCINKQNLKTIFLSSGTDVLMLNVL